MLSHCIYIQVVPLEALQRVKNTSVQSLKITFNSFRVTFTAVYSTSVSNHKQGRAGAPRVFAHSTKAGALHEDIRKTTDKLRVS